MHVLLQYQSKSYYIIGQEVYYSIGRFITLSGSYYIIGRFLLHYRPVITVSGVYYIIGWYRCSLCYSSIDPSFFSSLSTLLPSCRCIFVLHDLQVLIIISPALAMMSILHGFVLSQMPSSNPRTQRRLVYSIRGTSL